MSESNGTKETLLMELSDDESSTSYGSVSTITGNNTSRSGSNTPTLTNIINKNNKGLNGNKKGRGKKSKKTTGPTKSKYVFTCTATEDHGQSIFGAQFHHGLSDGQPNVLATVGSNRVTIYECPPENELKLLLVYQDPDPEEIFYSCAWTCDPNGHPLLAAAGARGVIRIFSPQTATCVKHFLGHGQAINDVIFHPLDLNVLLSASKDHSLRLWNIATGHCVAIFGGVEGHRDEVLGVDIHFSGSYIVSCGMDHSLKMWSLKSKELEEAINLSYKYTSSVCRPFPTVKQHFPVYSTRDVHRNYVDCAKWFGDFILSKSCENTIVCWKGGRTFQKWDEVTLNTTDTTVIHRLEIKECEIWFIRFSMDLMKKTLALGNQIGKTYIFDMAASEPSLIKSSVLSHPKCEKPIRQTALSKDGSILICVCDDGTLWRWDLNKEDRDFDN